MTKLRPLQFSFLLYVVFRAYDDAVIFRKMFCVQLARRQNNLSTDTMTPLRRQFVYFMRNMNEQ